MLTYFPIQRVIYLVSYPVIYFLHLFTHYVTYTPSYSFTHLPTDSLAYLLSDLYIHLLTDKLLNYTFTYSFTKFLRERQVPFDVHYCMDFLMNTIPPNLYFSHNTASFMNKSETCELGCEVMQAARLKFFFLFYGLVSLFLFWCDVHHTHNLMINCSTRHEGDLTKARGLEVISAWHTLRWARTVCISSDQYVQSIAADTLDGVLYPCTWNRDFFITNSSESSDIMKNKYTGMPDKFSAMFIDNWRGRASAADRGRGALNRQLTRDDGELIYVCFVCPFRDNVVNLIERDRACTSHTQGMRLESVS